MEEKQKYEMALKVGAYDSPQTQSQGFFCVNPYENNIIVFGEARSGKTVFLKNLLVRMHKNRTQELPEENIYILDFGDNLEKYGDLPEVRACFSSADEEYIKRVFGTIETCLEENTAKLEGRNYYDLFQNDPEDCPAHVVLIIDNLNRFMTDERYSSYHDRMVALVRDGISKGISVIVTAVDTRVTGRMITYFGQKIVFDLAQGDYYDIFGSRGIKSIKAPGRGVANIRNYNDIDGIMPDQEGMYEVQCFLPFANQTDENTFFKSILEDLANKEGNSEEKTENTGKKIKPFPKDLIWTSEYNTMSLSSEKGKLLVGMGYDDQKPFFIDINEMRAVGIYGRRRFGKTNLLCLLIRNILNQYDHVRFVLLDDGRKQLDEKHVPLLYDDDVQINNIVKPFDNATDLRSYLLSNEFINNSEETEDKPLKHRIATQFTVFIIQSRAMYQAGSSDSDGRKLMFQTFPEMIANAEARNYLFIFSDIHTIASSYISDDRAIFNNELKAAFLLDDIGPFVSDRGAGDRSVFGDLDSMEQRFKFAKCSIGDGFYYDLYEDPRKIKFFKYV